MGTLGKTLPPTLAMIILTVEQLEAQGVPYHTASQFTYQNQLFTKGQSFSPRARQVAIALCENYLEAGDRCFLVESGDRLTLCSVQQTVPLSVPQPVQAPSTPPPSKSVDSKASVPSPMPITYRGVKVESAPAPSPPSEPQIEHSEPPQPSPFQRTYRGARY